MEPNQADSNKVYLTVDENLSYVKSFFGQGINLVASRYEIFQDHLPVGLVYIDSIAEKDLILGHVVSPLLKCSSQSSRDAGDIPMFLKTRVISVTDTQLVCDMPRVLEQIMSGETILFIENSDSALVLDTRKLEKRSVEAPENETTVLGSQESFTDDLKTNCNLILKRLPVPNLKFEEFAVGKLSRTKVKLIWLEGIANTEVINEARSRIQKVDIDNINGIGALAEMIEDKPLSIFPKYRQSERPDVAAKVLADGHFVILCSNSPFALLAPVTFWETFLTIDDYQERSFVSSYLRFVRYASFLLSITISGLYIAFVTYNQAIVPAALAINIAAGREGVPLPSVLEMLLLTLAMSMIREAGVRMPKAVGYFVGTLSAIIIGQAIVTAGYFSAALIIVVAVSTISSFAISSTIMLYPARLLNYTFIILAGFFGMFGVICGFVFLFWHLITLSSFGVPFLYPLIPYSKKGYHDLIFRSPLFMLRERLKLLAPQNRNKFSDKGLK